MVDLVEKAREFANKELVASTCSQPQAKQTILDLADKVERLRDGLRECRSAANSMRFAAPELMEMHVERIEQAVEEALNPQEEK